MLSVARRSEDEQMSDTGQSAPAETIAPAAKFRRGQMAKPGVSPADVLELNEAQGDPVGSIDLETALAGDPDLSG